MSESRRNTRQNECQQKFALKRCGARKKSRPKEKQFMGAEKCLKFNLVGGRTGQTRKASGSVSRTAESKHFRSLLIQICVLYMCCGISGQFLWPLFFTRGDVFWVFSCFPACEWHAHNKSQPQHFREVSGDSNWGLGGVGGWWSEVAARSTGGSVTFPHLIDSSLGRFMTLWTL